MQDIVSYIVDRLAPFYPRQEAQELAYWLIEEQTGMNRFAVRTCREQLQIPELEQILDRLCHYEPIQYIFGHTEWMGLDIRVTPATLIPRPETAEMVGRIQHGFADRKKSEIRVLDVGTGSGCIALALKQRHPELEVTGLDLSAEAIAVARTNAERLELDVQFVEADILREDIGEYNLIVSNPPYIRPSERGTMTRNTLLHEPAGALFVPDDDPLLFYRRIASLHRAPELWFEISETQGEAMIRLMHELGYEATCIQDIYGKDRFIHAT